MTEEEIEACRLAFEKFDADGSGTIEANELKVTLQSMGQNPTDEEIFEMLSSVDEDGSGLSLPRAQRSVGKHSPSLKSVCTAALRPHECSTARDLIRHGADKSEVVTHFIKRESPDLAR